MSKDLNINLGGVTESLKGLSTKAKKYSVFAFFVGIILVYSFLVFQINQFSSVEPSDDQITEQLKVAPRPQIDQDSIDKIERLRNQNVGVQSLFKGARDNPFQDN